MWLKFCTIFFKGKAGALCLILNILNIFRTWYHIVTLFDTLKSFQEGDFSNCLYFKTSYFDNIWTYGLIVFKMLCLACLFERSYGDNCKLIALGGCFADRGKLADHAQTLLGALWACEHTGNVLMSSSPSPIFDF